MTAWMRHPNLPDALIEVPDASVPGHRLMGWRETDPPPPPPLEEADSESALGPHESRSATASDDQDKEE